MCSGPIGLVLYLAATSSRAVHEKQLSHTHTVSVKLFSVFHDIHIHPPTRFILTIRRSAKYGYLSKKCTRVFGGKTGGARQQTTIASVSAHDPHRLLGPCCVGPCRLPSDGNKLLSSVATWCGFRRLTLACKRPWKICSERLLIIRANHR